VGGFWLTSSLTNGDTFRDRTAVAGVGHTNYAALRERDPERSAFELGTQAFEAALSDAGLRKDEIDGLILTRVPDYLRMASMLGLTNLRFANQLPAGGRFAGMTVQYAALAVAAGLADCVACIYGNNGRSVGATYGGEADTPETASYDAPYGMTSPGAYVAHMFRRHQFLYGTPEETLGTVTINDRRNAALNPVAVMRTPFTMEDYRNARYIAAPLRLLDYCLINDGGVCLIITSAERARDLRKPPVLISATAAGAELTDFYSVTDFFYAPLQSMAAQIYPAAGVERSDIDVLQVYDNFTPTVLFSLEGLGFCGRGESKDFITAERIALTGDLPINTSGGHLSESYMQGWALLAELVRQLRGECGDRQVADCRVGQYVCAAPLGNSIIMRGA
jgi:acetyl-CoA acetyltransferase